MSLRSSALPKLAACSSFKGKRGPAGPAALRGTTIDYKWRQSLHEEYWGCEFDAWDNDEDPAELNIDDIKSLQWGIDAVKKICGSDIAFLMTKASDLKVDIPRTNSTGEMDGLLEEKRLTFDLKTGMIRNYREQMAAYALGMMTRTFTEDWTCYLIFCDQEEVVRHDFTFEEADAIVKHVAAAYHTPGKVPTQCEYCGWCAHQNNCITRIHAANQAFNTSGRLIAGESFDEILDDEDKLSEFLDGASVIGDYQAQAKNKAKELGGIDGWKTVKFKGREFVKAEKISSLLDKNGIDFADVLEYVRIPAAKLRELIGDDAETAITRGNDVLQLRKAKRTQ